MIKSPKSKVQSPRLIPFRAEHLLAFSNRDTPVQEEIALSIKKERGGPAYTGIAGEMILGCAGVVIMWQGVGAVWMSLSDTVGLYKIWFHRICRRALADIMRAYDLHRIEAVVRSDNERNRKWIEALGFKPEGGTAHAYTQDRQDAVRYELVRL